MSNKRIFIYAFVFILLLILSSCKKEFVSRDDKSITFTDALGREVSVSHNPRRVAALIGSFADVWTLAGGSLCATAEDAWTDFGLELDDAINIGGAHSPSIELLISSSPDFVIASASTASNVEMKDSLESMGITVAYFDVDSFENYLDMLCVCTNITGRRDLYEKNGLDIKEQIDEIKLRYQEEDIPDEHRRVLLLRASSGAVKAKGSHGTILGEMLSDMGCINVADSDKSLLDNLTAESVIRENPYHIFVVTMGNNTDAAKSKLENMIKENPVWSSLDAVKNGRLYVMDKTLFNMKPNERWADAYEILYEKLTKK